MAVSLGQNLFSRRAQLALGRSTSALTQSFERLSSGQRINRASDDAAGLAVSDSLKAKGRILGRARLNINDGVSALEIAQSALGTSQSLLTRMAELAQQAANGSMSRAQRKVLDAEYQQLSKEILRIQKTTQFNGVNVINGGDRSANAARIAATIGGSRRTDLSGDGRYLTYTTDNSIEQLDVLTGQTRQVTDTGSISHLLSSAGGETIIFVDTTGKNVFKWSRSTGEVQQVVDGTGASNSGQFTLSADGSTLAFFSTAHYGPNGQVLSDNGVDSQLHVVNLESGVFSALQFEFSVANTLTLSSDGSFIAFLSSENITGSNPGLNLEGFVANTGNLTASIRQIEGARNASELFGVSNTGRAFFVSTENPAGLNSTNQYQVFSSQYDQTGSLNQLTTFSHSGTLQRYKLNSDGETISFLGDGVIGNQNPDLAIQAFRLELSSGELRQLTSYSASDPMYNNGVDFLSADGYSGIFVDLTDLYLYDFRLRDTEFNIETGAGGAGSIQSAFGALDSSIRGLGTMLLTSRDSAGAALDHAFSALQKIGQLTGIMGAAMSRLEVANRLVAGNIVVTDSARSRIVDTDIASETAALMLNKIRQQTGASILAQANLQPQLAIQLLRN